MALYSGGNCQLTKSGVSVGSVPMNYTRQSLPIASTPIAFDAVRDDGQVIRFTVQTGLIITPPGTALKLLQTVSGFTLTDDSDNIEVYDSNGRLLSVTSRTGVVQTMNYDGAGKLGGVTDNFGHQLTLGYDAQNRLISVTRQ
jgi:YD repeat-containing protein